MPKNQATEAEIKEAVDAKVKEALEAHVASAQKGASQAPVQPQAQSPAQNDNKYLRAVHMHESEVHAIIDSVLAASEEDIKAVVTSLEEYKKNKMKGIKEKSYEERVKVIRNLQKFERVITKSRKQLEWTTAGGVLKKVGIGLGIAVAAVAAAEGIGYWTGQDWMRVSSLWADRSKEGTTTTYTSMQMSPEIARRVAAAMSEGADAMDVQDKLLDASAEEFRQAA